MPGYGYRILKQTPVTPSQRVAGLIQDLRERVLRIEATRPGFSISDTAPTTETPQYGFMHLDKTTGHVYFYTERGWLTADSRHYYTFDVGEAVTNSASQTDTGTALPIIVPPGGGFVMIMGRAEVTADGATTNEVALQIPGAPWGSLDLPFMRFIVNPGTWRLGQTAHGTSVGAFPPGGSFFSFRLDGGAYTIKMRHRNFDATGTNVRTRRRSIYTVIL